MAKLKDGSQVFGSLRVNGSFLDSSGAAGSSGNVLTSTGTGTDWIAGVSGSFTTTDGKTVTVTNGIITSIV